MTNAVKKRKLGERDVRFGDFPVGDADETDDEADVDYNEDME
jgi:hypothetical protein